VADSENAQKKSGDGSSNAATPVSPSATFWLVLGLIVLLGGFIWASRVVKAGDDVFKADGTFAALAGFTVLALSLERFSEAVLAPWWGKVKAQTVEDALPKKDGKLDPVVPATVARSLDRKTLLGTNDVATLLATSQAAATAATANMLATDDSNVVAKEAAKATEAKATETAEAVQSAWEKAVAARPTLILPAAAIATVLCAYMNLFLFHSIAAAESGLPTTRLAFAIDALLTGLALAGGAKPFHDLIESIAAKSTSNKQEAAATATGTPPAG
jgi:hypothetical protein